MKTMRQGAETPEQLMRSRYCAFAWGDVDYLIQTTHEDLLYPEMRSELVRACNQQDFVKLEVLNAPLAGTEEGFVEFVAHIKQGSTTSSLHERSRFLREEGKWLYQSGEMRSD